MSYPWPEDEGVRGRHVRAGGYENIRIDRFKTRGGKDKIEAGFTLVVVAPCGLELLGEAVTLRALASDDH
jgi:hypothetical protein